MFIRKIIILSSLCILVNAFLGAHEQLIIVLLGLPGSGKTTQAEKIGQALSIPVISPGALLRTEDSQNTEYGQMCRQYMEKGEHVPDTIILDILFRRIADQDCDLGYILDGFPRTVELMNQFHKAIHRFPDLVIAFEINADTLLDRLKKRLVCHSCGHSPEHHEIICKQCGQNLETRVDDSPQAIQKRIELFNCLTKPVISVYRAEQLVLTIRGDQPIEKIHHTLMKQISQKCKKTFLLSQK